MEMWYQVQRQPLRASYPSNFPVFYPVVWCPKEKEAREIAQRLNDSDFGKDAEYTVERGLFA